MKQTLNQSRPTLLNVPAALPPFPRHHKQAKHPQVHVKSTPQAPTGRNVYLVTNGAPYSCFTTCCWCSRRQRTALPAPTSKVGEAEIFTHFFILVADVLRLADAKANLFQTETRKSTEKKRSKNTAVSQTKERSDHVQIPVGSKARGCESDQPIVHTRQHVYPPKCQLHQLQQVCRNMPGI